jgi:hypothetical protein
MLLIVIHINVYKKRHCTISEAASQQNNQRYISCIAALKSPKRLLIYKATLNTCIATLSKRKTVNESNKMRYKKARSDLDGDLFLALAFLGLFSHSEGVNVVVA